MASFYSETCSSRPAAAAVLADRRCPPSKLPLRRSGRNHRAHRHRVGEALDSNGPRGPNCSKRQFRHKKHTYPNKGCHRQSVSSVAQPLRLQRSHNELKQIRCSVQSILGSTRNRCCRGSVRVASPAGTSQGGLHERLSLADCTPTFLDICCVGSFSAACCRELPATAVGQEPEFRLGSSGSAWNIETQPREAGGARAADIGLDRGQR
jgi:hypothetical protein